MQKMVISYLKGYYPFSKSGTVSQFYGILHIVFIIFLDSIKLKIVWIKITTFFDHATIFFQVS